MQPPTTIIPMPSVVANNRRISGVPVFNNHSYSKGISRRRFMKCYHADIFNLCSIMLRNILEVLHRVSFPCRAISLFYAAAICCIPSINLMQAATFIEGSMAVEWPMSSSPIRSYTFSLTIVTNNSWKLITKENGIPDRFGHRELSCDGHEYFLARYLNPIESTNRVTRAKGSVFQNTNSMPIYLEDFAHVFWLSYISTVDDYLNTLGNTITSALVMDLPSPIQLRVMVAMRNDHSTRLQSLRILNDGFEYGQSGRRYPLAPPMDKGYLQGLLRSSNFASVGSQELPRNVDWFVFLPKKPAASNDDVDTATHVTIAASNITTIPDPSDIRPQVGELMSVTDYRLSALSRANEAIYLTTNGWSDPGMEIFQTRAKSIVDDSKIPFRRISAIAIFSIVSLLGLTYTTRFFTNSYSVKQK